MATQPEPDPRPGGNERGYADFQDHLAALDAAGLLHRVDRRVDKDSVLHPLVRWQFRGGLAEADRKAFLFTDVVDAAGRGYDFPVAVGALAANAEIYAIGMGVPVDEIGKTWQRAMRDPIPPAVVSDAQCHDVVLTGEALRGDGRGLDAIPVPISTPGYDAAPYLTATCCISADPDTGVQNMGTYRAQLKAPDRLGLKMFVDLGQGGYDHWLKCRDRGRKLEMAIVVGCPPPVAYCAPQKIAFGTDELAVAGGIVGRPINVVRAKTVDLLVPAEAEFVIEGTIDTEYMEPEGPFGESHGHINLEEYNFIFEVTAIAHRDNAVFASIVSQVTPSESSVVKRVAYEPLFLEHLRDRLGIAGVRRVSMHEPLTNLRRVIVVQVATGTPRTEVWRALYGTTSFQKPCGKYVIAVNEDIDPENADAVFWAMAYRSNPERDTAILPHRDRGHGPKGTEEESSLLIDATLRGPLPPVALPKREYMERARLLWDELGLPALKPEPPWHGYSLGDWSDKWDADAARAAAGGWRDNGERSRQRRRSGVRPNDLLRDGEDGAE